MRAVSRADRKVVRSAERLVEHLVELRAVHWVAPWAGWRADLKVVRLAAWKVAPRAAMWVAH